MTLVVSKIIDRKLHNISDSLITDTHNFEHTYKPNMDMFTSILKTAIVHRHLCISYAGTVKVADDCLNQIINKESYTIKVNIFRSQNKNYYKPISNIFNKILKAFNQYYELEEVGHNTTRRKGKSKGSSLKRRSRNILEAKQKVKDFDK